MFLLWPLRRLLALIPSLLGRLLGALSPAAAEGLLAVAWRVGRNPEAALAALQAGLGQRGPEAALARADAWMLEYPQPQIAAYAGLVALQQREDVATAADMLNRGKALGDDPTGRVDVLELLLAISTQPDGGIALARAWEDRRDLAPLAGKMVLSRVMWDDLARGDRDQAARRAEHLLEIDDDLAAACILWALNTQQGRTDQAARWLRRAGDVEESWLLAYQIRSAVAIGEVLWADHLLAELEQVDRATAVAIRRDLQDRAGLAGAPPVPPDRYILRPDDGDGEGSP